MFDSIENTLAGEEEWKAKAYCPHCASFHLKMIRHLTVEDGDMPSLIAINFLHVSRCFMVAAGATEEETKKGRSAFVSRFSIV